MCNSEQIIEIGCNRLGIPYSELKGKSRKQTMVEGRYIIMDLLREKGMMYEQIGYLFDRDHSTVVAAVKNVANFRETDMEFREKYDTVKRAVDLKELLELEMEDELEKVLVSKRKAYICGKVTGLDRMEVELLFNEAESKLRANGYQPVNPLKIVPEKTGWIKAMRLCINELLGCKTILLLPGWNKSRGAKLEMDIARELELNFLSYHKLK